ncbi:MAG TPA: sigma-70 family RNA polymerase sigma factor [Flavisolibacter sp.]|nr:sigma-70 family RNA polymerase sigma factor [Flavisolibacter sp.]
MAFIEAAPTPGITAAFFMTQSELIPHLFRTEFRKITAVLCKAFSIEHMQMAEDIASETFLAALETWTYRGIPDNPVGWLYAVAKNKARSHFIRNQVFLQKVVPQLKTSSESEAIEIDLSEQNIMDSQLRMTFAVCHPSIPAEAQVALALRILCGFGIEEIANAFLTNKETINKRLFRAKEKLREEKVSMELPAEKEIAHRLNAVLKTLYLLYNEGYYSESGDTILKEDLCLEAMRLTHLLTENERTDVPAVSALLSLMCFHSSRFKARTNESGEMILYQDQDESLWDRALISKGAFYLRKASVGTELSVYHLEAGIAWWHTVKCDTKEKWESILQLYNRLLQLQYSPVAALNRTFALAKANGKGIAIAEAEKLKLTSNRFYFALLGELYTGIDHDKALQNFEKALEMAVTVAERRVIENKIAALRR